MDRRSRNIDEVPSASIVLETPVVTWSAFPQIRANESGTHIHLGQPSTSVRDSVRHLTRVRSVLVLEHDGHHRIRRIAGAYDRFEVYGVLLASFCDHDLEVDDIGITGGRMDA